jgi:FKBP-type peptidyl-prolyl cis-trans isomerase (trigger factor)
MMNIKIKKINSFSRHMSVKIPWKDLEPDFNVSMKGFSKKMKLPGFRAGKIPRKV